MHVLLHGFGADKRKSCSQGLDRAQNLFFSVLLKTECLNEAGESVRDDTWRCRRLPNCRIVVLGLSRCLITAVPVRESRFVVAYRNVPHPQLVTLVLMVDIAEVLQTLCLMTVQIQCDCVDTPLAISPVWPGILENHLQLTPNVRGQPCRPAPAICVSHTKICSIAALQVCHTGELALHVLSSKAPPFSYVHLK